MKKNAGIIITVAVMLVIMLIPMPADALYLRFSVREGSTDDYRLYYTTVQMPVFDGANFIDSYTDERNGMVTFRIDPSMEGTITGLRLDFPPEESETVIDGISVNSGGIVKRSFSVPEIFNDAGYLMVNGMNLSTVASRETLHAVTTPDDPFVIFGPEIVKKLTTGFSHKFSTKLLIVLLIAMGMFFHKKDYFGKSETEGSGS